MPDTLFPFAPPERPPIFQPSEERRLRTLIRSIQIDTAASGNSRQTNPIPEGYVCAKIVIHTGGAAAVGFSPISIQLGWTNNNTNDADFDAGDVGLLDPSIREQISLQQGAAIETVMVSLPNGPFRRIKARCNDAVAATGATINFILEPETLIGSRAPSLEEIPRTPITSIAKPPLLGGGLQR